MAEGGERQPFRIRFRVPLTIIPLAIGVVVTLVLWGDRAHSDFFVAATHVLALGAVCMALSGHFFRLATHVDEGAGGIYVGLNVLGVLAATGLGLAFAFHALAVGHSGPADLAITAGALSSGISAFGVQAMFGTPGMHEEEDQEAAVVP
jgi:hypothetical protein